MTSPRISIVTATSTKQQLDKASSLSSRLSLPLRADLEPGFDFHLVYTDYRLELQQNPHQSAARVNPISVDFLQSGKIHQRISSTTIRDPLPKAVGVKSGIRPSVVDATAGLGIDGFTLAWLGCKVFLIERSPIIHALLEDGLSRALSNPDIRRSIGSNITLLSGNSTDILRNGSLLIDVVYVDPMYPTSLKGPLNKKEMRFLRFIVGDDDDAQELFAASLKTALKRVVVKRPKGSETLSSSIKPSHQTAMKSGRFDVYMADHL